MATDAPTIPSQENFSPGTPVEVGTIDRELKKVWSQNDENRTRASLINLALYSEDPNSLSRNTEIVRQIAEKYAFRAIVVAADPSAKDDRVEAWINAHCHVNGAGNKQVCSEQLSFLLDGPSAKMLPSVVFSQLDSDLPFYFWWQDEFRESIDSQLWIWVDRLIYDSQVWKDFSAQLFQLEAILAEAKQRIVLCDLNWTRLVHIRLAIAQFFDHAQCGDRFASIERVEIDFAPEFRSTALLLVGWLAAQLRWSFDSGARENELIFVNQSGKEIQFRLSQKSGQPIGCCALSCGKTEFRVAHSVDCDLLEVTASRDGAEHMRKRMPAGGNDAAALLTEELIRGGPHRVYLRALDCLRKLF